MNRDELIKLLFQYPNTEVRIGTQEHDDLISIRHVGTVVIGSDEKPKEVIVLGAR